MAFCGPLLRPLFLASFCGLCLRLLLGPLFSIFWQFLRRCVLFSRPFFGLCFCFFGLFLWLLLGPLFSIFWQLFTPFVFCVFSAFSFSFSWPFVCGIIFRPLSVAFFGAFVFDFLLAFCTVCFLRFFSLFPLFLSFFDHGCTADP